MKIIQKNPNQGGAYPSIQEGAVKVYDGYAMFPETLDSADFYAHNGFVVMTIENINGIDTVTSYKPNIEAWESWKASLPEISEEPTELEQLRADIDYIAMETGVEL